MIDYLTVIRCHGEDIIGVVVEETEDIVKLETPFVVLYVYATNTLHMAPFCSITDETCFEFKKDDIQLNVTPSDLVSKKYIEIITALDTLKATSTDSQSNDIMHGINFMELSKEIH